MKTVRIVIGCVCLLALVLTCLVLLVGLSPLLIPFALIEGFERVGKFLGHCTAEALEAFEARTGK